MDLLDLSFDIEDALNAANINRDHYSIEIEDGNVAIINTADLDRPNPDLFRTAGQAIINALTNAGYTATYPHKLLGDVDHDEDLATPVVPTPAATEPATAEQPATEQTNDQVDAAAILTALRAAGRTVRQIAAQLGVAASTIYRWARGTYRPNTRNTARLYALAA